MLRLIPLFLIGWMVFCTSSVCAQEIQRVQSCFGKSYFYKEERLNLGAMSVLMQDNEMASEYITKAQNANLWSLVVGVPGGFIFGWQVGAYLAGATPQTEWLLAGAGLVLLSLPLSQLAIKRTDKAVEYYNQGINESSSTPHRFDIGLSMTANSAGIKLTF